MSKKWNIGLLALLGVLVIANAFGDWPEEIDSNNYTGSWTQVYTDIMKAIAPLQGAIIDTNISATADIDGSKLEDSTLSFGKHFYGVPYFPGRSGDSSVKYCYGDAKLTNDGDVTSLTDSLLADSLITSIITFTDSADVGNPAFGATPNFIYALNTTKNLTIGGRNADNWDIEDLIVIPDGISATACTLYIKNNGDSTAWIRYLKVDWQAMETKD